LEKAKISLKINDSLAYLNVSSKLRTTNVILQEKTLEK